MISTVTVRYALALALIGVVAAATPGRASAQQPGPAPTTSAEQDPLTIQVKKAVEISSRRYLTWNVHSPWQIMHGLLGMRQGFRIKDPGGKKVKAIDLISNGARYGNVFWFQKTRYGGRAHPYSTAYSFEGHPHQFLAILAMANLPLDHRFRGQGGTITVKDIVDDAKANVVANKEVSWTLWALCHYLGPDAAWQNRYGEQFNIERLVNIQNREQVNRAACGGTHGLFALSYARNVYLDKGRPLRGVWLEAEQKIRRYVATARQYQNRDGTFSHSFFQGRRLARRFEDRLHSSGHTLEFLMMALPQQRLKEQWVRRGVAAVARDLIENKRSSCECGALYHAVDGLVIYLDRIASEAPQAARKPAPEKGQPGAAGSRSP